MQIFNRIFFVLIATIAVASSQAAKVTFRVDMSQETVSTAGVFLAGSFQQEAGFAQDWDPSATKMQDNDADGIYEITLNVPAGYWEFKYVNGNTWAGAENARGTCTKGATFNRFVDVGSTDLQLAVVTFNQCPPEKGFFPINMPDTSGKLFWWNNTVFYEIFVRSFADSDGDGIGDFQGIIDNINYLNDQNPTTNSDLGIGGIWLMPMMQSTSYHGYDVEDYYQVEKDYGTMSDFQRLLDTCHAHGIKVIIDLVINHTSVNHPWFKKSAANDATYKNWYRWDANPSTALGPWGQVLWHRNNQRNSNYYGIFWSGMPDLNYEEPAVFEEIKKITSFWLDLGVDGFRLDAIKYLDEDGDKVENTPETFYWLNELREHVEASKSSAFMVGEVWDATNKILPYVSDTTLNSCFDFDLANAMIGAVYYADPMTFHRHMAYVQSVYPRSQQSTFLTNHDQNRVFSILNNETQMKQAAALYLSLPGVPFVYYGEEIGMTGTGDHLNIRTPMQWNGTSKGGFTTGTPWQGFAQTPSTNNILKQQQTPNSIWNHYQRWISLRNRNKAVQEGIYWPFSTQNDSVLTYARMLPSKETNSAIWISHNLGKTEISLSGSTTPTLLSQGTYFVYDALNDSLLGNVIVDDSSKVSKWQITQKLGAGSSVAWELRLDKKSETRVNGRFDFGLYPNPSSDFVYVQNMSKAKIKAYQMYNAQFQCVQTGELNESTYIDVKSFAQGLYYLQVLGADNSIQGLLKFVKE